MVEALADAIRCVKDPYQSDLEGIGPNRPGTYQTTACGDLDSSVFGDGEIGFPEGLTNPYEYAKWLLDVVDSEEDGAADLCGSQRVDTSELAMKDLWPYFAQPVDYDTLIKQLVGQEPPPEGATALAVPPSAEYDGLRDVTFMHRLYQCSGSSYPFPPTKTPPPSTSEWPTATPGPSPTPDCCP